MIYLLEMFTIILEYPINWLITLQFKISNYIADQRLKEEI